MIQYNTFNNKLFGKQLVAIIFWIQNIVAIRI